MITQPSPVAPLWSAEELFNTTLDAELLARIPRAVAQRLCAVPLLRREGRCLVGMRDPLDIFAQDELAALLGMVVTPVAVDAAALREVIDRAYRRTDEIRAIAAALQTELEMRRARAGDLRDADTDARQDAPVMRLLQSVFADAIEMNSSDIHLEPEPGGFRIRHRVDGFLNEQRVEQPDIFGALIIRLKLMAEMDIAEKRLPQEGRFVIGVGDEQIDIRLATMPTQQGESAVLRLLTSSSRDLSLTALGLGPEQQARITELMADPHGMMLVVGPTGSGKSTTLNAVLGALDSTERKLVTVEDPIECHLERATQVQVNPRIGLDFSAVLRSLLRHDPDVIMVGEMRDAETADIAVRAALTGHMVLSTLHCRDAASSIPRLLDMGVAPYLIAGALRCVLAQRLVRLICPYCAREARPNRAERAWLHAVDRQEPDTYRRGAGCNRCGNSGFLGRVGIYELLELGDDVVGAQGAADLNGRLVGARGASLLDHAVTLAERGQTTYGEIQRVLGSHR